MDELEKNTTEQSAWNLSQMLILQINNLLEETSKLYTKGFLKEAFFKTREIRFLIYADLKPEEIKECKRLERFFFEISSSFATSIRESQNYALSKYREYIFTLLGKYGYLVGKKEDSTRLT